MNTVQKSQRLQNIENAVADVKRQLRAESKSEIIRQWIALYAQTVNLAEENQKLQKQIDKLKQAQEASKEQKND